MEEDALHLRAEATARSLGEVARAQQALRATVQRLQVQLRGAWLGQVHQEFETLKVRGSQALLPRKKPQLNPELEDPSYMWGSSLSDLLEVTFASKGKNQAWRCSPVILERTLEAGAGEIED